MYKNTDIDIENRIITIINKIKPFLINDGGNLEFIKYENNIVYVKLIGACAECNMMDITLKDGIEQLIINEIPEVKEVINIDK
ncbi:MAG: NifU family protein [Bacilli bacterium]|nr:NifU family protein [Bacilli bacterium]